MLHIIFPTALSKLSSLTLEEKITYAKSLFYSTEAFAFGLLMSDISKELKSDSKIKNDLMLIAEDLMNTRLIEGVDQKLEQLSKEHLA